jgi:uncharacterized protein (DUF2336 family)
MIVRQFLNWVRTAPSSERAEATSALARAFLYSDLSPDDLAAAEGAMIMLLDDPAPMVRSALAESLASSERAPQVIIHALAADQPQVAAVVLQRSPLFLDADLVDAVARGAPSLQVAIARREHLPCAVSAAIAEIGCAEACLELLENSSLAIMQFSLDRIVERHGHLSAIRTVLLERSDLPAATRHALVTKLSATLAAFVTARDWLAEERADSIAKDACERATVTLAASSTGDEVRGLFQHLRASGQLTAGLLLRGLLCGNLKLFEDALVELTDLPAARVAAILRDKWGGGIRALYDRAGLPATLYPAFREALDAMREEGLHSGMNGGSGLKRRIVDRVLTRCSVDVLRNVEPLLALLRGFSAEAAREEARAYCSGLVADNADANARVAA